MMRNFQRNIFAVKGFAFLVEGVLNGVPNNFYIPHNCKKE